MVAWPREVLPRIAKAGLYRLSDRGFPIAYLHPTVAIHLHGYRARIRHGARVLQVEPGDLTVSPPDNVTSYDISAPGPCWCVHFESPQAATASGWLRLPTLLRPRGEQRFFAERFARLVGWWSAAPVDAAAAEAARASLYELMAALASGYRARAPAEPASADVERATAWLDAHYRGEVSVERLARDLRLRQDRLSAAFRRRHGLTILDYLARKRVEHAHLLLATSALPIATIAKLVGLPDRRYFTRVFRRVTGVGPRAVRAAKR